MENLPLLGLLLKWLKWPRPEPGVASGSLRVLAIVHCFPRHIIRELDWKLSNQDSNWLPIWNTDVAIGGLMGMPQHWFLTVKLLGKVFKLLAWYLSSFCVAVTKWDSVRIYLAHRVGS